MLSFRLNASLFLEGGRSNSHSFETRAAPPGAEQLHQPDPLRRADHCRDMARSQIKALRKATVKTSFRGRPLIFAPHVSATSSTIVAIILITYSCILIFVCDHTKFERRRSPPDPREGESVVQRIK